MLIHPPPPGVVAEVSDHQLRGPAEMAGGVLTEAEGVRLHQASDTAAASAVLTVPIDEAIPSPGTAAVAAAARVLVGAAEDVAGLVSEHPVNVVEPPAVV